MNTERLLEFLENHLIILDNAKSHNNETIKSVITKSAITKSGNDYLFCVPYTPKTDAIEAYFNQIKTYMKKNRNVDNAIDKVKPQNYKNYFDNAYKLKENIQLKKKPSTRRRKLKVNKKVK